MGNCYIFNPARGLLNVTLNNVYLGPIYPAGGKVPYQPQSILTPLARYVDDDSGEPTGYLAVSEPNVLSVYYPDDPLQQFGPYAVKICIPRGVSVDDDLIIYAGRPPSSGAPSVVTMTTRGFALNTACTSATMLPDSSGEDAA